jgi:hypothetical protein
LTIEMIESLDVTLALFAKPEKPQVSPRPAAGLIKKGPFPIALGIPSLELGPPRMRRELGRDRPM